MNIKGTIIWIGAWVLMILFIRTLGFKGFIGFIAGIIIATCFVMMLSLKYNQRFFTMAEMFADTLIKKENGKDTNSKKRKQ